MDSLQSNRAFKYGDGIFETFRYSNSKIYFIEDHFERLKMGFKLLSLQEPQNFSLSWLKDLIHSYIRINAIDQNANLRIRISFWRDGAGLYTPDSNSVKWLIEHGFIQEANYVLNECGLLLGLYKDAKISRDKFSSIKKITALPYVLASIYKKSMGLDDVFLVNTNNRIIEASSSNVFIVKEKKLLTPDLKEGPVSGVLRKQVIKISDLLGLSAVECKLKRKDFEDADEILLCNVISGIRWVKEFNSFPGKIYGNEFAKKLTIGLNEFQY